MKKRFIIFLLSIICVVVLCILGRINYLNSIRDRDILYEYNEFAKELHEEEDKEMLKPSGIFLLNRAYEGDNDLDDFYRSLRQLAEENKDRLGIKKVTTENVKVSVDTDSFKKINGGVEFNITLTSVETSETLDFKVKLDNVVARDFIEYEEVEK